MTPKCHLAGSEIPSSSPLRRETETRTEVYFESPLQKDFNSKSPFGEKCFGFRTIVFPSRLPLSSVAVLSSGLAMIDELEDDYQILSQQVQNAIRLHEVLQMTSRDLRQQRRELEGQLMDNNFLLDEMRRRGPVYGRIRLPGMPEDEDADVDDDFEGACRDVVERIEAITEELRATDKLLERTRQDLEKNKEVLIVYEEELQRHLQLTRILVVLQFILEFIVMAIYFLRLFVHHLL